VRVSIVDLIAVALIAATALSGFRRGLVVGLFSLGGLVLGFYLGAHVVPALIGSKLDRWVPIVGLGGALACGTLGQIVGSMAGRSIRRALLVLGPLRLLDSIGGAVLGGAIGIALCWAVGAVFLYLPGQTELRSSARDSRILARLNEEVPPTRVMAALASIDPFTVLAGPAAGVGPPDPAVLDTAGVNAAALSVVRVIGNACGLGVEGSGWVAGPGLVVTNAHVVAGMRDPRIDRNDGDLLDAQVVSFDRHNDIAVLRVPSLQARILRLADPTQGRPAALLGYPGNGPYVETPVRVGRIVPIVGRDAYGTFPTSRLVVTFRGAVRSGNSGGPVVDAAGRVVTTAFARRAGTDGGYGVPAAAVRRALSRAGTEAIETPCLDR
jgi:S1-C subfamily serine protease